METLFASQTMKQNYIMLLHMIWDQMHEDCSDPKNKGKNSIYIKYFYENLDKEYKILLESVLPMETMYNEDFYYISRYIHNFVYFYSDECIRYREEYDLRSYSSTNECTNTYTTGCKVCGCSKEKDDIGDRICGCDS